MNIYEDLRRRKHKNNNQMEKEMTIVELVKELNAVINGKKLDRNVITRIENGSQSPTPAQLIAYSKVFDVSIDYILNNLTPKSNTETIKNIADFLALSDSTIEEIKKLDYLDKLILDKMISHYSFLPFFTQSIKRMLAFNAYSANAKIVLSKTAKEYDSEMTFLEDVLNQSDIKSFIYVTIDNIVHNVLSALIEDTELKDILQTHYTRNIRASISTDDLKKMINDNVNITAKQLKESDD